MRKFCALVFVCGLIGQALADPPAGESQSAAPPGSFFSSLKQAFRQDLNYEVVRGHFDIGAPPDTHRFYCLVDIRTGREELYGVAGEPVTRPDGMTGIKAGAVSPDSCARVEEQGRLVTSGYVVNLDAKAAAAAPVRPAAAPSPSQPESGRVAGNPDKIDVAGIRLGMSPEQVRAALRSRMLGDYFESMAALSDVNVGEEGSRSLASTRFTNLIAAWSGDAEGLAPGESYQVMFTPIPGKERVMAIVHSVEYAPSEAIDPAVLKKGLMAKYGGYSDLMAMPDRPTWRMQSGGAVLTGDTCDRRNVLGAWNRIEIGASSRRNIALNTAPEEFRYQIGQCGVAIVTEDHAVDRVITRFTVTAYSPTIAFDGATTAAQLMQTKGATAVGSKAPSRVPPNPNL